MLWVLLFLWLVLMLVLVLASALVVAALGVGVLGVVALGVVALVDVVVVLLLAVYKKKTRLDVHQAGYTYLPSLFSRVVFSLFLINIRSQIFAAPVLYSFPP